MRLRGTPSQQSPCSDKEIHWQFVRYAIVGFCSNAILYFIYLVATNYGIGYKTAMILLYAIGILLTFLFNRRWTFDHQGFVTKAFIRYISVYGLGYVFNLAALFLFMGELEFPYQLVQGIFNFCCCRALVFAPEILGI